MIRTIGATTLLFARTVRTLPQLDRRATLRHLHELGARSALLVMLGMAFFGAVMVTLADAQARQLVGDLAVLGPPFFELLVREFGPVTSALLSAARNGASDSAELSSMVVNEQVEALQMSAGDPVRDLIAPRVLASAIALPLLCILGTASAAITCAWVARTFFAVPGWVFLDPRYLDGGDVASALVKAVACGIYIPLVAALRGLAPASGVESVGEATTRGVVAAFIGCLVIDFLVAMIFRAVGL